MSDEAVVVSNPVSGAEGPSAGALLRSARDAAGLHVAALAVAMKVPVKKLEALEGDRFDELPDAVFVRALASSVCRTLKVDAAPILAKLPQYVKPSLGKHEGGVRMPHSSSSFLTSHSLSALATKPTVMLVALLLLATLAVVFVPEVHLPAGMAGLSRLIPAEPSPPTVASEAAVPMAAVVMATEKAAVTAVPAPAASASVVATVALPAVPQASSPSTAPAKAASASEAVGSVAAGVLVFKAKDRAWIRVRDSKGTIQFEKTLAAGETAEATGGAPLSVIIGNAAGTEVVLRGQPFDLESVTQNNVARFEVK